MLIVPSSLQKHVMKETYVMKKAALQWRAARKWMLFVMSLKHTTMQQLVALFRHDMDEVLSLSELPFPVTTLLYKAFLWWLAVPRVEEDHPKDQATNPDSVKPAFGPRGHNYTYVQATAHSYSHMHRNWS